MATLAVYGQVAGHQFIVLDDQVYIQNNPMVTGGLTWKGIVWAFTTFYDSNWHPLAWIAHMADVQMFGLNAGRHLLVNALIHVANTWLLFLFLKTSHGRQMAERNRRGSLRPASPARGIGRVGDRTQRYVVDFFWLDHPSGVRPVFEYGPRRHDMRWLRCGWAWG